MNSSPQSNFIIQKRSSPIPLTSSAKQQQFKFVEQIEGLTREKSRSIREKHEYPFGSIQDELQNSKIQRRTKEFPQIRRKSCNAASLFGADNDKIKRLDFQFPYRKFITHQTIHQIKLEQEGRYQRLYSNSSNRTNSPASAFRQKLKNPLKKQENSMNIASLKYLAAKNLQLNQYGETEKNIRDRSSSQLYDFQPDSPKTPSTPAVGSRFKPFENELQKISADNPFDFEISNQKKMFHQMSTFRDVQNDRHSSKPAESECNFDGKSNFEFQKDDNRKSSILLNGQNNNLDNQSDMSTYLNISQIERLEKQHYIEKTLYSCYKIRRPQIFEPEKLRLGSNFNTVTQSALMTNEIPIQKKHSHQTFYSQSESNTPKNLFSLINSYRVPISQPYSNENISDNHLIRRSFPNKLSKAQQSNSLKDNTKKDISAQFSLSDPYKDMNQALYDSIKIYASPKFSLQSKRNFSINFQTEKHLLPFQFQKLAIK